MNPHPIQIELVDGSTLENSLKRGLPGLVVLRIAKREVLSGLTGDVVDRLSVISDRAEYFNHMEGRLAFYFDGWDGDPREIPDIPECRNFFSKVTELWPYWFHYLSKFDHSQVRLALNLLTPCVKVRLHNGGYAYQSNPQQLRQTIDKLFDAMNGLYAIHDGSLQLNMRVTNEVVNCL